MVQGPLADAAESERSDTDPEASDSASTSTSTRPSTSEDSPLRAIQFAFSAFTAREDLHRLGPWDHLLWATRLPVVDDTPAMPGFLNGLRSASASVAELQTARESSLAFWRQRKLVTDPQWRILFKNLPAHCQSVLGPGKNLLLLKEMLDAIDWPDKALFHNLCHGFPLVGNLPLSGVRAVARVSLEPAETLRSLLKRPRERNEATLGRIARQWTSDAQAREAFLQACSREIEDGKARLRNS